MILMNMQNGEIKAFIDFEFIKENFLALYGEKESYLIEQNNIQFKLENGEGYCQSEFPILYDTTHGPLTNDMIHKYGVSVSIFFEGTKDEVYLLRNILRTTRKNSGIPINFNKELFKE